MYDSKNYIVINKPPNYAVHGGSGLNFGIIEIVRKLYKYSENCILWLNQPAGYE